MEKKKYNEFRELDYSRYDSLHVVPLLNLVQCHHVNKF